MTNTEVNANKEVPLPYRGCALVDNGHVVKAIGLCAHEATVFLDKHEATLSEQWFELLANRAFDSIHEGQLLPKRSVGPRKMFTGVGGKMPAGDRPTSRRL